MLAIQPQTQQLVTKENIRILHFKMKVFEKSHRMLRLEGISGDHPVLPPAKAGSPEPGDTGMCPGGF